MNQRIRELAEQAGLLPKEIGPVVETRHMKKKEQDLEKFAELIVRECMLQCIKVENDVELSDYEGGFKDGALLCYQEIQEHFGVADVDL